jgi:putative methionine-R-sulfoxide reductase with GAF domain
MTEFTQIDLKLKNSWKVWYHKQDEASWEENSYLPIYEFSTLRDFYGFINRKLVQLATTTTKLDANHIKKNKLSRSIDKGVVGRVIRSKKGEIINDTSKDIDYVIDDRYGLSEITVPVLFDGDIVGIIDSKHAEKNHYAKDKLATLSKISILISLYLKNSASELEKKLKEKELEATRNRLGIIFESYSDAKIIESKDRYIEFVSNAFLRLFNIPLEEHNQLIGLSCKIAWDNSKVLFLYENEFVSRIEEIVKNQEAVNDELLELKDGRFFSRSYNPIFLNGKLDGHVWTYRDVTLQINYDKSLEFQNHRKIKFNQYSEQNNHNNRLISNQNSSINGVKVTPSVSSTMIHSEGRLYGRK